MPLITQREGDVVELTLDWPETRNAMGPQQARELRLALDASTNDLAAGAVVISAAGPSFCAGGNLKEIVRLATQGPDVVRSSIYGEFQGVFRVIRQSPVPIITAINGAAIGFGCDLALAGAATFIGRAGFLAQGWSKAGLIPATGGTVYVAERGGPQAVWKFLAAEKVDGPTAEAWGLAIACEDARSSALDMARSLVRLPRKQLRSVVQLARIVNLDDHLKKALEFQVELITSAEFASLAQSILAARRTTKSSTSSEFQ